MKSAGQSEEPPKPRRSRSRKESTEVGDEGDEAPEPRRKRSQRQAEPESETVEEVSGSLDEGDPVDERSG